MLSYSCLTGKGDDHDGRFIEVVESRLRAMLRPFLLEVKIDEEWYLRVNADVRAAIKAGQFASARDHYAQAGYFEDRWPRPIEVATEWYLETYPDVADAIRAKSFESAQQHFGVNGFREGRLPFEGWTLQSDRGVPDKVQKPVRSASL